MSEVDNAKQLLQEHGYVVIKEKSYKAAQERQRTAEILRKMAEEDKDGQRRWMERDVFTWERHLVQRVDHLAGLAVRMGASKDDLLGPPCTCGRAECERFNKEYRP